VFKAKAKAKTTTITNKNDKSIRATGKQEKQSRKFVGISGFWFSLRLRAFMGLTY